MIVKSVWISFGFLSLCLGLAGIFLPLLPTTPFLLLSAFCFARSSEKLHNWLLFHPRFGVVIADWQERGSISRTSKITAVGCIVVTFLISVAMQVPAAVLIVQIMILSAVTLFIVTRPD